MASLEMLRVCSKSKCKNVLPACDASSGQPYIKKQCVSCRESDAQRYRKKRARQEDEQPAPPKPTTMPSEVLDKSDSELDDTVRIILINVMQF